ncbi:MAG TPA: sigma-70 family RNA polymerase sigma factor [Solirubrobacteraceae bacterium]|nr:sigma-70 family RNA polymerase sigma factor [Solirubrobacteraceae bacterium]
MNQASVATLDTALDQELVTAAQDQRLVGAAREGDDRAFEQLYERYRPRIRAFALRMTRDPDRADDLVQDVFLSALRRLRETEAPIVFRPWIYEIARNACIDEYRRRRRITEVPLDRDRTEGWLEHLAGAPSPEVAMESKQQLEDLCGAFRGLSERHHQIIVARELEGKSYRQIGDELEMSQVVVESTLFRARRRLTEEFQELSTGRRCERVLAIITTAPGRRLGVRERRAVATHIEHCHPCRREALAAGLSLEPRRVRPLQKAAAVVFPVPLFRLLRRAVAAAHQRAVTSASSVARFGQSLASVSPGRMAAAVLAVAAGVGGGLLSQPGQAPAQPASRHAAAPSRTVVGSSPGRPRLSTRPLTVHSGRRAASFIGASRSANRLAPGSGAAGSTNAAHATSRPSELPGVGKVASRVQASTRSATSVGQRTVDSVSAALGNAGAVVKASANLPAGGPRGLVRSSGRTSAVSTRTVSSLPRATNRTVVQHSPAVP